MRLLEFRVTNYRSVEDSGWVTADDLVCLVGKNEAGKSAVLQALTGLNPHPSTPRVFDRETDYPRRFLQEYDARRGTEQAIVIDTKWSLHPDDRKVIIEEFGTGSIGETVSARRRYGGAGLEWDGLINHSAAVQHLIDDERLTAAERKVLTDLSTSSNVRRSLEALTERTERQQRLLDRLQRYPNHTVTGFVHNILRRRVPTFMYFSHYDRMVGQIRVDTYCVAFGLFVERQKETRQSPGVQIA